MSWDGLMMRIPKGLTMADLPTALPAEWRPPGIGSMPEVQAQFARLFPGQQHREGQTCIASEAFWIEFNYRVEDKSGLVESIGIRSNVGIGAIAVMKFACDRFDVRLVDCQTSEFADFSDATIASMNEFAEWRDRAI